MADSSRTSMCSILQIADACSKTVARNFGEKRKRFYLDARFRHTTKTMRTTAMSKLCVRSIREFD